jgi:uncharacterized circularly permuted ATP-grasp superfamily protein
MNSAEIANNLIDRARNLREFTIEFYVNRPILFDGAVPFDISINQSFVSCKVLATSEEEARQFVDSWLKDRI